jgi:uncharacterized protein (TIGR03437 family)
MRNVITGGVALVGLLIGSSGTSLAATFGSIVQVRGEVSDIAVDQTRGVVYAANLTANRIEVVSMSSLSLQTPIQVAQQPSAVALSPNGQYLVVGHYYFPDQPNQSPPIPPNPPCNPADPTFQVLTVIDLVNAGKQTGLDPGGACVMAVAFGNGPQALVVSTDGVRLLNPATGALQVLTLVDFQSKPLPVPWATFPASILSASAGVSGDGTVIYALVDEGGASWQPLTQYALGDKIIDPADHFQVVVQAGESGPLQPTWNDTGGYTFDGSVIWQDQGPVPSFLLQYTISTGKLVLLQDFSVPRLGPRVVSVNQNGSQFLAAWALFDTTLSPGSLVDFANFPYPPGVYDQGSIVYAPEATLACAAANVPTSGPCMFVYAQVAPGTIQATLGSPSSGTVAANTPLLSVADSDNLTIREIFQLSENLAGKSLVAGNPQAIYAVSNSGLTVFPIGSMQTVHRVKAVQPPWQPSTAYAVAGTVVDPAGHIQRVAVGGVSAASAPAWNDAGGTTTDGSVTWQDTGAGSPGATQDLVFNASICSQGAVTQYIQIVDPSGGQTDFTLSTTASGVTFSPASGTTPAIVAVTVNTTSFAAQNGTTAVPVQITSVSGVNVPAPVRLLINTRTPPQVGTIYEVPGTLVDVLADPGRQNIFYVIQQDQNMVLAFQVEGSSVNQIAAVRTGNTPVQMAITQDDHYLLVTNDNSQFASVFDLTPLSGSPLSPPTPSQPPILFPGGYYPRSIAVSNNAILATSRVGSPTSPQALPPPARVHRINFTNRTASPPASLGIYQNCTDSSCTDGSALAALSASPSGAVIFMPMADGTVALYEALADTFVASRHDLGAVSGAYAALSDNLFAVDVNILNEALVPIGQVNDASGLSSGVTAQYTGQNTGLFLSAPSLGSPGTIQQFDLTQLTAINSPLTAESPFLAGAFTTTPIGQVGQTILPFSRTLAPLPPPQSGAPSIVFLSTSGFTVLTGNYAVSNATPPVVTAVESAADGSSAVAPGGLIAIYGAGLSASNESAGQIPLPTTLGNTCASVNNESLPLFYVSPSQINAQLPFDASGSGSLIVSTSGASGGISSPFSFNIFSTAPTIFMSAGAGPLTGLPNIYRANDSNSLVTLSNPIRPNDTLTFFATGMGQTSNEPLTGYASPANPPAIVLDQPIVTLEGIQLNVTFAGLAPGEVGVYQINAVVPAGVPGGLQVPLTITQGGQSTSVMVRVVRP